jgi:hypothetical protein
MSLILVKNLANLTACGKNVGGVFFDIFRQPELESEVRISKIFLDRLISKLLTLFVRDCRLSGGRKEGKVMVERASLSNRNSGRSPVMHHSPEKKGGSWKETSKHVGVRDSEDE